MPSLKLLRTALALSLLWGGAMAQETLRSVPYKPDPPFAIDGSLGDWQSVPGPWSDTLAGVVRLAWRAEALFLAVESTDDDPRFLALTVEPGPGLPRRSLLLAMDGGEPVLSSLPPATLDIGGVRAAAGAAGPGLLLEASIPWDVVGLDTVREGQVVRLHAALQDHTSNAETALAPALLVGADGTLRDAPPIVEFFG